MSLLVLTAVAVAAASPIYVLPQPKTLSVSGPARSLSSPMSYVYEFERHGSNDASLLLAQQHLAADAARQERHWPTARATISTADVTLPLSSVRLRVRSSSLALTAATDVSHVLTVAADSSEAVIEAATVFGAQAALVSLRQLISRGGGALPGAAITLADAPDWAHRGLMLDAGRRFFPVPLMQNIIDTMQLTKLNLLHLHASDECRFGIESKIFPNLTARLVGDYGGFYSQADITALVAYGLARGVRIMLEVDVPGHSRGLLPLAGYGAVFCDPQDATCSQMFGDPANKTYDVITRLLGEIIPLFPEPLVHIGCDETNVLGVCTLESTFAVERLVLDWLQTTMGKTPAGWEEIEFDAGAATPQTVVYAWARHTPGEIIDHGYVAVDSDSGHFYLTQPGGVYPGGWQGFWYGIGAGLNASQSARLLGGEMSQWTDTFCITDQCGASNGPTPVGSALFPPSRDAEFATSIGGMLFPRAIVGAAAFWSYNATMAYDYPPFVEAIWALNDQIAAAGGVTCPSHCVCDQLTQCGKPIIPPKPPAPGMALTTSPCALPISNMQAFTFAGGKLSLSQGNGSSLCVANPAGGSGNPTYPLKLAACDAPSAVTFGHAGALAGGAARMVDAASGGCLDLSSSGVGIYDCGSDEGLDQLNQAWAVDATATTPSVVVSLKDGSCLTAQ